MNAAKKIIFIIVLILIPVSLFAQSKDNLKKAISYYNKGNYSEAVKLFDLYLEKKSNPEVYFLKGYALYKMSKFNKALDSFRQAYLIDPKVKVNKATDILLPPDKSDEAQISNGPGDTRQKN